MERSSCSCENRGGCFVVCFTFSLSFLASFLIVESFRKLEVGLSPANWCFTVVLLELRPLSIFVLR